MNPVNQNPRLTKKRILSELRKELGMRLKVWPMADRANKKFLKLEHQVRFEQMVFLGKLISKMSDHEFLHYADRVALSDKKREAAAKVVVRDLFTTNENNGRQEAS